jgi:hypothetical protein
MTSQPPGPPPVPPSEPPPGAPPPWVPAGPYQPAHGPAAQPPWWKRRTVQLIIAGAAAVIAIVVVLVVVLAPSGPLTVTGTVTSTVLGALGGNPNSCILNLPDQGSQLLMKADGVTVASADLANGAQPVVVKSSLGETCSVKFTFTGVPAGKTLYEVTIDVSDNTSLTTNGCTGTVYYKPSQLSKPLTLSCS